jgi:ribokinase
VALSVVVVGYASGDRPVVTPRLPEHDTTAVVRREDAAGWPQLGGCAPRIARHLGEAGVRAGCVTWVADDAVGGALTDGLGAAGVDVSTVAVRGTRTAESFLVYADDGTSLCFFDPGDAHGDGLTPLQHDAVAAADVVCLAVAPERVTRDALAACRPDARVAWSVKADPNAYPPDLVAAVLARADVVSHADAETAFLGTADGGARSRPDALVLRTRGADGVTWTCGERSGRHAVEPIEVANATGAGDAFVAGVLTRLITHPADVEGAVRAGAATSRALLVERTRGARA